MKNKEVTIEVKQLWKSFGSLQVLKGMDLDVYHGETVVIMGRSGVGKSVLLKHILGMEKPDRGSVKVDGLCISQMNTSELTRSLRNMGMLFQGSALFDSMSVKENVAFYLRAHGHPASGRPYTEKEITSMVGESLERVGLGGTEEKLPSDLSGGMRRRAALARVIVYRPEIILYDEPTTGLDPITGHQINDLIVEIQRDLHATSIVVTHDMHSALTVADRIALHDNGKIKHIAEKEAFLEIDDPMIQEFVDATLRSEYALPALHGSKDKEGN